MLLAQFLFLFASLLTVARCTPINSNYDPPPHVHAAPILTTGLESRTQDGHVPIRREVRDLKNNFPVQWNLYLLGLRSFQLADESLPHSYYGIAGIHGRPYKVWENAQGVPGKNVGGYCPHGNILFSSWHRPYLALYEQYLYKHVQDVASRFPPDSAERHTSTANEFRVPYWDWAIGESGGSVPEFFLSPTIEVTETDGSIQTISNPLHHFDFHPIIPGDFDDEWAAFNSTLRWPTTNQSDAVSQNEKFVEEYDYRRREYRNRIGDAFVMGRNMNEFSSTHLEPVHGYIHFAIAKGSDDDTVPVGHMWPSQYAAFEPLFMLHHCNVDRLFALRQASRPNQYMEPVLLQDDLFWIPNKTTVDVNTPLMPFWRTPDSFWTTEGVWDTTILGYAYPETQSWNYPSDDAYRASINATIAQLYSPSARATLTASAGEGGSLTHLLVDGTYTDWSVQIRGSHMELPSSFIMRFYFVGDFSSDPVIDVGAWTMFGTLEDTTKLKKRKRASTLEPNMKGMVGLTAALLDDITAGKLETLKETDVVPYLTGKLTWKLFAGDGKLVPHNSLRSLAVEVMSTTIRIPNDPNVPLEHVGEWNAHPEVMSSDGRSVRI